MTNCGKTLLVETVKTLRLRIPSGDAGADVTARALRQLIEHGKRDPAIRQTAVRILRTSDVTPHDRWGEVRALHGWVQRNVRYVRDPHGIEYVQTPSVMLSTMVGDCDDYTAFLGALLETVGYPVDVKIIGRSRRRPFHHVYPVVHMDGLEVALDASMPVPFGFQSSDLQKQRNYRSELDGMRVRDVYGGSDFASLGLVVTGGPPKIRSQILGVVDRYVSSLVTTGRLCSMSETQFLAGFMKQSGAFLAQFSSATKGAVIAVLQRRFGVERAKCEAAVTEPGVVPGVPPPDVGGCFGVPWPDVVLQPGQKLTDRCVKERIASGKIKAASGCVLDVVRTVDPAVHTVVCVARAADIAQPPPGVLPLPTPSGVARCDWPHGRGPTVFQEGESVSGHCVKRFLDMGVYRPAEGCRLVYQGPVDPTRLPGPVGKVTCVPVGYDQPPEDYKPPPDYYAPPEDYVTPYEKAKPYMPGTQPPTVITVPGAPAAYPEFKEAGFPTWAIIALGAALVLPMLLKGKVG